MSDVLDAKEKEPKPAVSRREAILMGLYGSIVCAIGLLWETFFQESVLDSALEATFLYLGLMVLVPVGWSFWRRQAFPVGQTSKRNRVPRRAVPYMLLGFVSIVVFLVLCELDIILVPGTSIKVHVLWAGTMFGPVVLAFGWLLPHLRDHFGLFPSLLLTSLLWVLCAFDAPNHLLVGAGLVGVGLVGGCLTYYTGNIFAFWPFGSIIGHAALQLSTNRTVTTIQHTESLYMAAAVACVGWALLLGAVRLGKKSPRLYPAIMFCVFLPMLVVSLWMWRTELAIKTGTRAKYTCSGLYIARQTPDEVKREKWTYLRGIQAVHMASTKQVVASWWGMGRRVATFIPGRGCILSLRVSLPARYTRPSQSTGPLPTASKTERNLVMRQDVLKRAVSYAFDTPQTNTRALVVLHDGKIVVERYAGGYTRHTRVIGHSMTKSVLGTLVGMLIEQNKIKLGQRKLFREWRTLHDQRANISVSALLHMRSGLRFSEAYENPIADVYRMIYQEADASGFAMKKRLLAPPDQLWHYSTGDSMLLSRLLRRVLGEKMQHFPYTALFGPLGMQSAIIEQDATGIFLGGSHMHATARDWARFGLLYANGGMWGQTRLLSRRWVAYATTPMPDVPLGVYGAHFWLNKGNSKDTKPHPAASLPGWVTHKRPYANPQRLMPRLPKDTFMALGFGGQYVMMIPSRKLVIVRLSHGHDEGWSPWHQEELAVQLLQSLRTSTR